MKRYVLKGKSWKFGDDIDTDVIIPARYLPISDLEELAKHTMEPIDPNFSKKVKKGDIIVAGENFGYGSSREHAALALKQIGIGAIVAESFARTFYRNAINNGLLAIECKEITENVEEGDELQVNLKTTEVKNLKTRKTMNALRIPDFLLEIVKKGGLIQYYKEKHM